VVPKEEDFEEPERVISLCKTCWKDKTNRLFLSHKKTSHLQKDKRIHRFKTWIHDSICNQNQCFDKSI